MTEAQHQCVCQTANRRLALVFGASAEHHPELQELFQRFELDWHRDLGTAIATVGPDGAFAGPAEVADLLSGVLGTSALEQVRATWLDSSPLNEQMPKLLRAATLAQFAPERDSPLAEILEKRRIHTWFQPIFDRRGVLWGHECLMRAFDETGAVISPGQLIEWARHENLLFMLDRVCRETHILSAAQAPVDPTVRFLINFLPSVIYKPEFCLRTTFEALQKTHLEADRVIFEVVESEAIDDREHLRSILHYYRQAGFGVALDDVGAGYSGLALLADLDPDLVKIDREIVEQAEHSVPHADICRSLIELGHRRDKQVLAEGVETEDQHQLMREMGADLFQGFWLGRPGPL